MPDTTGTTIVLAGAHHRDRVVLDATRRLRELGAVVLVQIVNDAAVDDMRSLAVELLATERRLDVLAHVGTRRGFDAAVVQPYLLTRLLADRVAESRGRVLWSVAASHRTAAFDADAVPQGHWWQRRADPGLELARALLVHEWTRRDERIGVASFEPDAATLVQLCGSDERLCGGHFADGVRVADAPSTTDARLAAAMWDRCATRARLEP